MAGFAGGHQGPSSSAKKEKGDFKSIKKLLVYSRPYYLAITISMLFAVLSAITITIGPGKIMELTDLITDGIKVIEGIDMSAFVRLAIVLIILYIVGAIASFVQQILMSEVTQKTSKRLRTDINHKINKLPLKYFDKTTRGDILSRVTNDVDTISQTLGTSVASLVNAVVLFIGVIIAMFIENPILALVTIGSSVFGFVFMFTVMGKSQKYFNQRQQDIGELNGHIEEIYSNHNVVKSYNAEKKAKDRFDGINKKLFINSWKSQALSGLMFPVMNFVGNFSYALIFIVGVGMIVNGSQAVTFGTIISFTIYARLFSQPLSTLGQSMNSLQQTSAASKRVFEMLEEKELGDEVGKVNVLKDVRGDVEFRNVRFGYGEEMIIHNFSANLHKGQKVAIVGPTGAGKTTIVNLLMRFYEVNAGYILIDGVSIKDISRENVHDLFDMILQDTWLFNGTIRENLVYNKTGVTTEELDKACEAVGLKHFIKTLKHGYETVLDDSISLSEGQKQQLTIARAMIKDSPLLILDEATSSVDTRTELVIQKAMDELTKGRTSFIIAHRLSTIRNADVILVMNNGDIIEQGNHEELLRNNGFYADIYNSQFHVVV